MAKLTLNFVNKNEGDLVKATVKGRFYNVTSTNSTTNNTLTLNILDGDYTLTVEGDGYEDYTQSVSVTGDTTVEVLLVPLVVVNYPYLPADNLYLGNVQVQRLYLGVLLLWEGAKPILINGASVGIHPNYVWIESRTLGDYRNQIEGRIKRIVLDGKVTIILPFEYDTWSDYLIELEGHPDNPMIYEEIRNKLGRQSAFSDVQVAIYT